MRSVLLYLESCIDHIPARAHGLHKIRGRNES